MGLIQKVSGTPRTYSSPGIGSRLAKTALTRAGGLAGTAAAVGLRALEEAIGMRFDPAPTYLFFVELSGVIVALFTECSGISLTRETEDIQEGGVNNYTHRLPGRVTQSDITLSRGLSISRSLWDWFMQGRYDFNVKRINFSIIQGAPGHNFLAHVGLDSWQGTAAGFGKVKHWDIEDAYPISWEISPMKTSDSESVVIETMKIAHHGLTLSYEVGTPMSVAAAALTNLTE